MNWMTLAVLTVALGSCFASSLAGQSLRGRVMLPDSTTPLVGVTVTLHDGAGAVASQTTSGASGRYTLEAPSPGPYTLRAIRIGYRPAELPLDHLAAGEVRELDLVMVEEPFRLAELAVTAHDRCRMSRSEREQFVELWGRARAALGPHVSTAGGVVNLRVLTIEGTEDGPLTLPSGTRFVNSNNRHFRVDSLNAREHWTDRFLARTSAEILTALGYAQSHSNREIVFDVPNPEVVLSDAFLANYCFTIEGGPRGFPEWVGIRFQPTELIDSLTTIAGTLWVSQTTGTLQRVDFEYRNPPRIPYSSCEASNRPVRTPSGQRRYGPYCFEYRDRGAIRHPRAPEGTGGSVEFAMVGSNEWLVSRWVLRTRGEEFMDRYIGVGERFERGAFVPCYDRPPACQRVFVAVPRLRVTSGAIASLSRDGVELYRDDATIFALDRIAALQATPRPGHVAGVVTDGNGQPVARAVVATDSPTRAAITDSAGRFELRTLPTRELSFSVTRPGFQPLGFRLPILADSTRQLTITLLPERSGGPRE